MARHPSHLSEIEIRTAEHPDVLGIVDVHARSFIETYASDALAVPISLEEESHLSRSTLEHFVYESDFLERKIASHRSAIGNQSDTSTMQVALHNDQIVGFSHAYIEGNQGTISALYVLPEFQRRRIGQALIKPLLKDTRVRQIDLAVVADTPAVSFYAYLGFETTSIFSRDQCPQVAPSKWLKLLKMTREQSNFA